MKELNTTMIHDIQNKYKAKKVYQSKHKRMQEVMANKYNIKKENAKYIEVRVDTLYSEIINKYTLEEEEIYDKLYLKVRKLFLEMM